jgi:hypothetical protein
MKLLVLCVVLLLSGCISGKMSVDQAGICTFEYDSFYKDMTSPELDLCGATLGADNSAVNDKILGAILNAISQ